MLWSQDWFMRPSPPRKNVKNLAALILHCKFWPCTRIWLISQFVGWSSPGDFVWASESQICEPQSQKNLHVIYSLADKAHSLTFGPEEASLLQIYIEPGNWFLVHGCLRSGLVPYPVKMYKIISYEPTSGNFWIIVESQLCGKLRLSQAIKMRSDSRIWPMKIWVLAKQYLKRHTLCDELVRKQDILGYFLSAKASNYCSKDNYFISYSLNGKNTSGLNSLNGV